MAYYPKKQLDASKKINALKLHTQKRAMQRLGSPINIEYVVNMIKKGKTRFIKGLSNNRTVHEVTIRGITFKVIYDKKREMLVTVLPRN